MTTQDQSCDGSADVCVYVAGPVLRIVQQRRRTDPDNVRLVRTNPAIVAGNNNFLMQDQSCDGSADVCIHAAGLVLRIVQQRRRTDPDNGRRFRTNPAIVAANSNNAARTTAQDQSYTRPLPSRSRDG